MDQLNAYQEMIQLLDSPAFIVQNGIIHSANAAAQSFDIAPGTPVERFIPHCAEEYAQLGCGYMLLTLSLCGIKQPCTVSVMNGCHLFQLTNDQSANDLKALALAAEQLRFPISDISLMLEQLPQIPDEKRKQINQNLYKLFRMLGNMSDAAAKTPSLSRQEQCSLRDLFSEVLEKSASLLTHNKITLNYSIPQQPMYSLANKELLTRAIYNLISNAAKHSSAGEEILAEVRLHNNKVFFSVTCPTATLSDEIRANLFTRYSRQPGVENPKNGLGLGMTLIHSAASAHGGTVLVETPQNGGVKFTMTLTPHNKASVTLRSPILSPDIYGGRDQALVELSDVLPYYLYE